MLTPSGKYFLKFPWKKQLMLSHQIYLWSNLLIITPVDRSGHEVLVTSSATNLSLLLSRHSKEKKKEKTKNT